MDGRQAIAGFCKYHDLHSAWKLYLIELLQQKTLYSGKMAKTLLHTIKELVK